MPKKNDVGSLCLGVDGVAMVRLHGELDLATRQELEELLAAAGALVVSTVVVDMSRVSFIDAGSIGVLVATWRAARDRGRRCVVRGLAEQPARVFDVLGLDGLLRPLPSVNGQGGGPVDVVERRPDARGQWAAR